MEERDYILFEEYLSGSLSEAEKTAFEQRLQNEKNLQGAFETYKAGTEYLKNRFQKTDETQAFEESLSKISERHFKKTQTSRAFRKIRFWQYGVAATVLVLVGIFASQWFSNPVYSDYANYPEISLAVRGANSELLLEAETAFNAENYSEAENIFSRLLETQPENTAFKMYRAVSLVETDQFEEADALFEEITSQKSAYQNQAKWFAALSKLKQKDYRASAKILESIPETAEIYPKVEKLLSQLK